MNAANQALQSREEVQAIWNGREEKDRDRANLLGLIERRLTAEQPAAVDLSRLIKVAAQQAVVACDGNLLLQVPEGLFVQGPAVDLHNLIVGLIGHACEAEYEKVELRAQVNYTADCSRISCTTEIVTPMSDVPDCLRRELWDVLGRRRGQVSITMEPCGSRIEFTLPLERRSGTILG